MPKDYVFKRIECPECGIEIAENWFIRHMKDKHPVPVIFDKPRTRPQPWIGSPEQLRQCGVEGLALHLYGELRRIITLLYDLPHTDREAYIGAIASSALNLVDKEIKQEILLNGENKD